MPANLADGANLPQGVAPLSGVQIDTALAAVRSGEVTDTSVLAAAVEELAATARHYQLLVDNMSDVVFRARLDRTVEWISSTVTELSGDDPADLIGRSASELVHPDDTSVLDQAAAVVFAGERFEFQCRIFAAEREERWVAATLGPVFGPDGAVIGAIGSLRDIHDSHLARLRLAESEEHYRLLAENSSDVVAHSRDGLMLWISPALTPALGWLPDEWVGRRIDEYVHPDDIAEVVASRAELAAGRRRVLRFRVLAKDGSWRWIESHVHPYKDTAGNRDGVEVSFRTVDTEVEAEQELERRATHDQLTGLYSRNEAFSRIAASMHGRRHHLGTDCALLFCDLDHFKTINDEHGHIVGDQVLRGTSRRIERAVRAGDLVARVGGDEILVALECVDGLDEAVQVAEQIRIAVNAPLPVADGMIAVTVSIGVTLAALGETVDATLNRADQAMYHAKHTGRDRVVAFGRESTEDSVG